MTKISGITVDQAFDVLAASPSGVTVDEVAQRMGVHKTTANRALQELHRMEVAVRERVNSGGPGQQPFIYSFVGNAPTLNGNHAEAEVVVKKTNNRPVTKKHVRRGAMTDLVREALTQFSPNGRGFTTAQLHKKIGQGSYETVRRAIEDLIMEGEVVYTGRCRHRSRVYLPTAAAPPAPVTAPEAPPVPANLTGLDALLDERDRLRARLAEIEHQLDDVRARLD